MNSLAGPPTPQGPRDTNRVDSGPCAHISGDWPTVHLSMVVSPTFSPSQDLPGSMTGPNHQDCSGILRPQGRGSREPELAFLLPHWAGPGHGDNDLQCVESHLAPRTPLDPTASKIHTNIYSVPARGWGIGEGAVGLDKQLPVRRVSDGKCSDARTLGTGSVPGAQGVPVG